MKKMVIDTILRYCSEYINMATINNANKGLQLNPDIVAAKIRVFPEIGAIFVITNFLLNKHLQYKSHLLILQGAKPGYKSHFLVRYRAKRRIFGKIWVKACIFGQNTRFLIIKLSNSIIFSVKSTKIISFNYLD